MEGKNTEEFLNYKTLKGSMGDYSGTEKGKSLDYRIFLEKSKVGNTSFDAYIDELSNEMQIFDSINPYKKDPLRPITDKADAFLKRHAGISYKSFLSQSKPEEFSENDYGKLPEKRNLKKRLFEHRSMFYLSALENCEQKGYDIDDILREVERGTIPFIKKEQNEPTFREILKVL